MSESSLTSDVNRKIEKYIDQEINLGVLNQLDSTQSMKYLESKTNNHTSKKIKNFENLYQEYEREKWNSSLNYLSNKKILDMTSAQEFYETAQTNIVLRFKNSLYATDLNSARKIHVDILEIVLRSFVNEVGNIIEIGAGDGGTLLPLLDKTRDLFVEALALDLSPSGLKKIDLIAEQLKYNVRTAEFNLEANNFEKIKINQSSTFITSFTLCCIPKLSEDFFNSIAEKNPKFVLHFEPIYENLNQENSVDSMGRSYIEINDYNTNFLSALNHFLELRNDYEIKFQSDVFFGQNPLLPGSIVCWQRKN